MTTSTPPTTDAPKPHRSRVWIITAIALILVGVLLAVGIVPRIQGNAELQRASDLQSANAFPVKVSVPLSAPDTTDVLLPGTVQAVRETQMYARTNGYVKRWMADIGANVKQGQVLAELETPELDQQLAQSRAALEQSRTAFARLQSVSIPGSVSKQEVDNQRLDVDAKQAAVRQLQASASFKRIVAPFAGTVTARNVDVGALVSSGSGAGAKEMFRIAQTAMLKIQVGVPQTLAPSIKLGLPAGVIMQEFGSRVFMGTVARTAGALDAASRTMLTEVYVPNPDKILLPGMYAQVRFAVKQVRKTLLIPSVALVLSNDGTNVIVSDSGVARYRPVKLGRDYGSTLEVVEGLSGTEKIVLNPRDVIHNGSRLNVIATVPVKIDDKPAAAAQGQKPAKH